MLIICTILVYRINMRLWNVPIIILQIYDLEWSILISNCSTVNRSATVHVIRLLIRSQIYQNEK